MTIDTIELGTDQLLVELDPGRGADFISLVDRARDIDVMFRTPWRERADTIRAGQGPSTLEPTARWLEGYRGGWQTLTPNGGDERRVHGAPVGFHGEASVVAWTVDSYSEAAAQLHVNLFSLPIRIDRSVAVEGATLKMNDVITNLSDVPLEFDYSNHPALGGRLLESPCRIETGARRFTNAGGALVGLEPGSVNAWPISTDRAGNTLDLREVPGPEESRAVIGWLDDFVDGWATVSNPELGLTVRTQWDARLLPFAWFWQELNATRSFPWFGRARTLAIEPASMPVVGPGRNGSLRLDAFSAVTLPMAVSIEDFAL